MQPRRATYDDALVDSIHAQYVAAIRQLFEKHKEAAGYGDRTLTII
jgi:hypothetical protein